MDEVKFSDKEKGLRRTRESLGFSHVRAAKILDVSLADYMHLDAGRAEEVEYGALAEKLLSWKKPEEVEPEPEPEATVEEVDEKAEEDFEVPP